MNPNSYQNLKQLEAQGVVLLDFFTYIASTPSLAAGASASISINIEADSAFILDKTCYVADIAGAVQTDSTRVVPLVTVQIKDSGSGRYLQSNPIPICTIAGVGELPFVLPQPRVFSPSSTINITFTNYSAATTYANLGLVLIGRKVFKF